MNVDGFDANGRTYPYWDENIESMVYRHDGPFLVSVSSMLFNNRIILTHRSRYPIEWDVGYCYDKGAAAGLAAAVWNPLEQEHPLGYKKIAGDQRGSVAT